MATFTIEANYRELCCSECGIVYFFPEKWATKADEKGTSWNCPNGHGQWFGESSFDKLNRERNRLKQEQARLEDEIRLQREMREEAERSAAAYKGQATKLRNRAKNGVCPCCSRSFGNLAAHMRSKHPDFGGPALKVVA